MKKIIACALIIASLPAFSATVKVTSFIYVGHIRDALRVPLAELCGQVEGATSAQTFIRVLIDPKSSQPSSYNTFAGPDGKFCTAVITFRGSADVTIMGEKNVTTAKIK